MLGGAIALLVAWLVLTLAIPWLGIPIGIVGLVLFVLALVGVGRRGAAQRV